MSCSEKSNPIFPHFRHKGLAKLVLLPDPQWGESQANLGAAEPGDKGPLEWPGEARPGEVTPVETGDLGWDLGYVNVSRRGVRRTLGVTGVSGNTPAKAALVLCPPH